MRPKARFIRSVIETARANRADLPWARTNRKAFAAKRRTPTREAHLKTA